MRMDATELGVQDVSHLDHRFENELPRDLLLAFHASMSPIFML